MSNFLLECFDRKWVFDGTHPEPLSERLWVRLFPRKLSGARTPARDPFGFLIIGADRMEKYFADVTAASAQRVEVLADSGQLADRMADVLRTAGSERKS